jgi:hypothetical protein
MRSREERKLIGGAVTGGRVDGEDEVRKPGLRGKLARFLAFAVVLLFSYFLRSVSCYRQTMSRISLISARRCMKWLQFRL